MKKFFTSIKSPAPRHFLPGPLTTACVLLLAVGSIAQDLRLTEKPKTRDFAVVAGKNAAAIVTSLNDFAVVRIAANDFAADVERVSGVNPTISEAIPAGQNVVIIGTIGKNPLIDRLVRQKKINITKIRGKRESFLLQTIANPFPGVKNALVVVGSDRRGTAFGVYELSQRIGVSPWVFWADASPEKRSAVVLSAGKFVSREPSVKFRGIFINDEDWGLQPWAAKTFEPENGNIGPRTYAKVFELLLRLKANTLWPAMHEVSQPFNDDPRNAQLADDYAVIMGSSHAEPMLRNNVGEWKDAKENFNFLTNETGVTNYWEERAKTNAKFESVWTIGMRGIHDSSIQGPKTPAERIATLEKIFGIQRGLLEKHSRKRADAIPQIFCPYKEVLNDYRGGLKVPNDVTTVFPDDNFGYIRQFPTVAEQKRKGGFGVYYHISYLGRPLAYLWLNTTPPALIFEEMSKAYANGMRDFWMLNVGDIKPHEIGIEFFMHMAYDADRWTIDNQHEFLEDFARREFGEEFAKETAAVLEEYFRLNFQRRPEHLQWHLPKEPYRPSNLNFVEKYARINAFAKLRERADAVFRLMPSNKRDSFYQLVVYPVRVSAAANKRVFMTELANEYKPNLSANARSAAIEANSAATVIAAETMYFNEHLKKGKWNGIMSPEISPGQWPSFRQSTLPKLNIDEYTFPLKENYPPAIGLVVDQVPPVIIEAEKSYSISGSREFSWKTIRGLGKTGDSVAVFPAVAKTFAIGSGPFADYQFQSLRAGMMNLKVNLVPTHPLATDSTNGLRFAISINGAAPVPLAAISNDTEWAQNVLNATTTVVRKINVLEGSNRLRLYAIDSGVVVDRFTIFEDGTLFGYF